MHYFEIPNPRWERGYALPTPNPVPLRPNLVPSMSLRLAKDFPGPYGGAMGPI